MTPLDSLNQHLERLIVSPGVAPGAVGGFAQRIGEHWHFATGCAGRLDPFDGASVGRNTWYDLASITKSVTALGVGSAVDRGLMQWEAPLATYLPSVGDTFGGRASVLSLLSHRSGLVAHVPLYEQPDATLRIRLAAQAMQPVLEAATGLGTEPYPELYSDLGYILLGPALERVTGSPLDSWLAAELARFGVSEILSARQLGEQGISPSQVAPTELVARRGGLLRARVHDDNAWALSETRTSGHAGLFGTALGILRLGTLLLDLVAGRSSALTPGTVGTLLAPRPRGSLRAGFDSKTMAGPSSVGQVLGSRTFGHLGFTGTSYWCDPETETVVTLLTNRVCPTSDNLRVRAARPLVHDALARVALTLGVGH